jgi:hypothetical protein
LDTKAVQLGGELAVVATEPTPAGHPIDTAQDQASEPRMLSSPQSKFRQLQVTSLAHDKEAAALKQVTQKMQARRVVNASPPSISLRESWARKLERRNANFFTDELRFMLSDTQGTS